MLQAPQGPTRRSIPRTPRWGSSSIFLSEQRKTLRRRSAREILADLLEWLEVAQRATAQDRKYVTRLSEFVKEWEPKSETRGLAEFVEYLGYYSQAGGTISLEDDFPGDAVQLMTVHGAKGLEFPQVFLLRINNKKFPTTERAPRLRISRSSDERRRTRRAISHSRGAPPLLRRSNACGKSAHTHDTHRKKRQDPCIHRGPLDGPSPQAPRRPPAEPQIARTSSHRPKKNLPAPPILNFSLHPPSRQKFSLASPTGHSNSTLPRPNRSL